MSDKSGLVGGPGQPLSVGQFQMGTEAHADPFRTVQLMPLNDVRTSQPEAVTVASLHDPTIEKRAAAR